MRKLRPPTLRTDDRDAYDNLELKMLMSRTSGLAEFRSTPSMANDPINIAPQLEMGNTSLNNFVPDGK